MACNGGAVGHPRRCNGRAWEPHDGLLCSHLSRSGAQLVHMRGLSYSPLRVVDMVKGPSERNADTNVAPHACCCAACASARFRHDGHAAQAAFEHMFSKTHACWCAARASALSSSCSMNSR